MLQNFEGLALFRLMVIKKLRVLVRFGKHERASSETKEFIAELKFRASRAQGFAFWGHANILKTPAKSRHYSAKRRLVLRRVRTRKSKTSAWHMVHFAKALPVAGTCTTAASSSVKAFVKYSTVSLTCQFQPEKKDREK